MTLFKRVFNNHAQRAAEGPIVVSRPMPADPDLDLDQDLAADLADASGEDPDFRSDEELFGTYEDTRPDTPLAERSAPQKPSARDESEVTPGTPLRRVPAGTGPSDESPSLAERAAQAQIDIRKSHLRRVEAEERADTRAQSRGPDPTPPPTAETEVPPSNAEAEAKRAAVAEAAGAAIAAPRPGRGAKRVRTRMLGFNAGADVATDPFAKAGAETAAPAMTHPVGWMVVTAGPGAGHAFALYNGVSTIGRGSDQTVALDFGDTSISREKHAAVAYDDEANAFFLGHGGKSNIVRLNNRPVLSTEDLSHGDSLRIGETTLRFVALCGADFSWGGATNASA